MGHSKHEVGLRTCLLVCLLACAASCAAGDDVKYGTCTWDAEKLGNHRAVVRVREPGDAARVRIPWRRHDTSPEKKDIFIVSAGSGAEVHNVCRLDINKEFGDLVFQPLDGPGEYHVYYMPYRTSGSQNYPKVHYLEPSDNADPGWLAEHGLTAREPREGLRRDLPQAQVIEIQAIDELNSFYPMEIIATRAETEALRAAHPESLYLLFPEDRAYPIRMKGDLPRRWIDAGITNRFAGEACRGEFYAFQIGFYAARAAIPDIAVRYSDLACEAGVSIPAAAFRCFNLGGIGWDGREFTRRCPVEKGEVQALWFGVGIPADAHPGLYSGQVTIEPLNLPPQTVDISMLINETLLADAGDGEPRRHSRLRWLDSRIAEDDGIVPPFTPMTAEGDWIGCLGRRVKIGPAGLPEQIESFFAPEMTHLTERGREVLASPIALEVESPAGSLLDWTLSPSEITEVQPGSVSWRSRGEAGPLTMGCRARMEFDGCIEFEITLTATRDTEVNDIRLRVPLRDDVAEYMMGMGYKGGRRPDHFQWKWDARYNQDSVWVGDANAGLQCSLKDLNYTRPLNTNFYHSKPLNMPPSWSNGGRGGCEINATKNDGYVISAFSGGRTIAAGEALHFNFRLLLTPFKPLDTRAHWHNRYYHRFSPVAEIAALGANTINVHHATDINPYINYPFLRPAEMKAYVDEAHARGFKVKIYYTVRELSNRAPELFALRSLGDEIFARGPGGGFSWLQEHLGGDYIAAWFVPQLRDAAIINSGVSRWHNYYLEGLNWLVRNVGIDGLYIDDVAFDRTVMKRLRKILDRGREGALIDLHSANQFNPRDGYANSANLYLEHFPFLNRLWFGEYFDYDSAPDFWLVELSGIPFGLMGEMLQDGGNAWRGMLYGMTSRLPWAGDPKPIWKAWDDFGIAESRMVGYWTPSPPVRTDRSDVLATCYIREGKTMVAIASWAAREISCRLDIDWEQLGLDPAKTVITAPPIEGFQEQATYAVDDPIPLPPGRGRLLILTEK